ncbi:glycerol-3-phosphate 1-O-acyltransferase PlsY [Tabrizicola sp.]|uniref:glycerol-3-phosphate 1-O-acyltransferase PlsY n=1 Tax=Tabrizicola sp. TaxID=2005166 RepID=UPI0035B02152
MPDFVTSQGMLLLTAVLGYLLGSIPFGILVTRAMGLGDLRSIGSGNIGATNVLRTGNKRAALATLLLDGGKGALAVLMARWLVGGEDAAQVAGLAAFLGHLYPVWLGFKGGKGVATFLGLFLALDWRVGVCLCLTWLVTAVATRYSSIAALFAAASAGLWVLWWTDGSLLVLALVLTVLVYVRHSANLGRLKAGTEPRIGQKKG